VDTWRSNGGRSTSGHFSYEFVDWADFAKEAKKFWAKVDFKENVQNAWKKMLCTKLNVHEWSKLHINGGELSHDAMLCLALVSHAQFLIDIILSTFWFGAKISWHMLW
jgi:hypothetical protein